MNSQMTQTADTLHRNKITWERDLNGTPQIKGYTKEYPQASSPRRRQIEEYLTKQGTEGYAAAQIAAHRTREAKINLRPDDMQRVNRALAAQYGDDPQAVVHRARMEDDFLKRNLPGYIDYAQHVRGGLLFARR